MHSDVDLRGWIGGTEERSDLLTPRLAEAFDATLDEPARTYRTGEDAPLGIHWCIGNPVTRASGLGRDGHPKREGFMPPVPLPRRMWAAGDLAFHGALTVGSPVTRSSTIRSIDDKRGRSGPLIFVVVEHRYEQDGDTRVTETQTLVFREDPKPGGESPAPPAPGEEGRVVASVVPDPVMLFRYSALTFNGHRIHYDLAYARDVEGYPGLVVHGPLIATLLLRVCAAARRSERVRTFSFRGLAPTFADEPISIALNESGSSFAATAATANRAVMASKASFGSPA